MTLLPGREISVIDYFQRHHKRRLKYPELPCVICGTSAKPVYFPLEVCHVPAQRRQLLQDSTASAEMIRVTAAGPDNRKRDIQSQMQNYVCKDRTPRDYGLDIKSQMVQVRARVLTPPRVFYSRDQFLDPSGGAWNLRGQTGLREAPDRATGNDALSQWAIISFDRYVRRDDCYDLGRTLKQKMEQFIGIRVTAEPICESLDQGGGGRGYPGGENIEDCLKRVVRKFRDKPQIVFCVLPKFDNKHIYNSIKECAEIEIGVRTQCIMNKVGYKILTVFPFGFVCLLVVCFCFSISLFVCHVFRSASRV